MLLLLASCALAIGFLRFHLASTTKSFIHDFEQQSFIELTRGETFTLARKLAALTKTEQFECVIGKKADMVFFEEKKGDCFEAFFRARGEIREPNTGISIEFYLRPQREMLWGLSLFFLLQAALAGLVFLSQRQAFFLEHRFQLDLAAMARQVAHDIRSPLAALSMIEKEGGHEKLRQDALGRLRNLVSSLLGEGVPEKRETLGDWLGPLVEEKQVELKEANVSIGALWSTDLKGIVLPGDAHMWRRVVSNLVNNAVEASKAGAGSVSIEVERCAEGFSISVSDNGAGIPAEIMGQIGQRGFTHGKAGGFGLGVFGAKEFVEGLGGQIQIISRAGGGTKVRLVVPPVAQTVVLIEDDAKLAELWQESGRKRGIEVRHFSSPDAFLNAKGSVSNQVPIYLDLHFPDSGADVGAFGQSLREQGFSEIFLCSGADRRELAKYRWAKGICGKEPPWL